VSCEAGNDLNRSQQFEFLQELPVKDRQPGSSFPAAHIRSPVHRSQSIFKSKTGIALVSTPLNTPVGPNVVFTSKCNTVSAKPVSSLPRSVLLLSGDNGAVIPFRVLWDSGSSHYVISPKTARRLGFAVSDTPGGHGTMTVADGSTTLIYGWTTAIWVRPPYHLPCSDGLRPLATSLPPMRCLVADISEDVIVGFDYILPSHGGFIEDIKGQRFFKLASTHGDGSRTVNIPLIGKSEGYDTHYSVKDGFHGPMVETYSCSAYGSNKKHQSDLQDLLQYQQQYPHMVTQIERNTHDPMSPEANLFPDATTLRQEPLPAKPADPRREAAWEAIQERFATVFETPSELPPYRFVNGSCDLKPCCSVPPRTGVGRLSQEEITYTK